mgnify:CR=1 FL=1
MPESLTRTAAAGVRAIETISTWAAGLCLTLNVGVVIFAVAARYGFDVAPIWTEELARYALIWAVLLAVQAYTVVRTVRAKRRSEGTVEGAGEARGPLS